MPSDKKYVVKKFGPITERRDYSKTINNLQLTDLVSIQKDSFQWFLDKGIEDAISSIYPIRTPSGKVVVEYIPNSFRLEKPASEFEAIKTAKQKGTTYGFRIYANLRKTDTETGEVKDQEVLFGELPLMTSGGTFIVNGSEKVIISQLLRSPGAYFKLDARRSGTGDDLFNILEIIPKFGIWIEFSESTTKIDKKDNTNTNQIKMTIDRHLNIPLFTFLVSLGMSKEQILELFGDSSLMVKSSNVSNAKLDKIDALDYIHGILRKGDRVTDESRKSLYSQLFFSHKKYDLSKAGRFVINRKLSLVERIEGTILAEDLKTSSGKSLYKAGQEISAVDANEIQDAFAKGVLPLSNIPGVDSSIYHSLLDTTGKNENEKKRIEKLATRTKIAIVKVYPNKAAQEEKQKVIVVGNDPTADEESMLISDLIAAISYFITISARPFESKGKIKSIPMKVGIEDDIDSLVSKCIVTIGELLHNQLVTGLIKLEKNARERMSTKDADNITPKNITNNKLVFNQFKSFFNSSQLSQFMDQMNPLSELSNKRRLTSLGPGGLSKGTRQMEPRDVHATHYGRICPIETPEGPNIGLILNFANYARVNEYGFLETPYYPVDKTTGKVSFEAVYLDASQEKRKVFVQSSVPIDQNNMISSDVIVARKDGEYIMASKNEVDYVEVSSKQMTSVAASAIPFLENDDANRALMGANMQRQAVPLIKPEAPFVGTGIEAEIARFSAANLRADAPATVSFVDSEKIEVKQNGKNRKYNLRTFERSNQGSIISQRPLVKVGDTIKPGDLLTDGPSFDKGELALGKNVLVAFSTWNGYNFEDAIVLSERLVKKDVFTSLHIEEQTIEFRTSKVGDDELTNEIPNVSNYSKRNLDINGVVRIGSEVEAGDLLVGRVSPKGEDNPTPEDRLIAAIFSQKQKNVKDTSMKVKYGHSGTVIDVQTLSRENGDVLPDDITKIVKVLIAQKRKIKVGDKMAGRHGNKGVVSLILPVEDMPHLADGTPIDILLNPQGVPSRMNIGQVLELHLGLVARELNIKFVTPVFDGIKYNEINEALEEAKMPRDGKFDLYDPISGRKFDNKVSVGIMYMLKLAHMVDDKMHARSVGPYSLITQQPLGGKSQNGGQRFGEMETWAIESYGATNVLQELLTYKSDNIDGRNKVYNSLASGAPLPTPGTPESFNVLAYELRGLGIKLSIETKDDAKNEVMNEIDMNRGGDE